MNYKNFYILLFSIFLVFSPANSYGQMASSTSFKSKIMPKIILPPVTIENLADQEAINTALTFAWSGGIFRLCGNYSNNSIEHPLKVVATVHGHIYNYFNSEDNQPLDPLVIFFEPIESYCPEETTPLTLNNQTMNRKVRRAYLNWSFTQTSSNNIAEANSENINQDLNLNTLSASTNGPPPPPPLPPIIPTYSANFIGPPEANQPGDYNAESIGTLDTPIDLAPEEVSPVSINSNFEGNTNILLDLNNQPGGIGIGVSIDDLGAETDLGVGIFWSGSFGGN